MQALEWVIVLLNCLLLVFPYILSLLDLGISGKGWTCFWHSEYLHVCFHHACMQCIYLLNVCAHLCIYIQIHVLRYTYTYSYTYVYIHVHTHTYTYTYVYINCTYTYIYTFTFIFTFIFIFIFKFIFMSIHICVCIYKQRCAHVVEGLMELVNVQLSRLSLSSALLVGTRRGGIATLLRRLWRLPTLLFLPVYTFWSFKFWYHPLATLPVSLLGPVSVALLHVICLFVRAYVYACVHTLTLVYTYTVIIIHMHTHINKCLQFISALQADSEEDQDLFSNTYEVSADIGFAGTQVACWFTIQWPYNSLSQTR